MIRFVLPLLLMLCGASVAAETEVGPLAPLDLSSPRATYTSFLTTSGQVEGAFTAYQDDRTAEQAAEISRTLTRSAKVFDLSKTPAAQRSEVAGQANTYLYDILLRLPPLDPAQIPGPEDDPARWTIPGTEIEIRRIEEGARTGEYLFSAATVARLEEFHARILPFPLTRDSFSDDWNHELMAWAGPMVPLAAIDGMPAWLEVPVLGSLAWKVLLTIGIWVLVGTLLIAATLLCVRMGEKMRPAPALVLRLAPPLVLAGLAWATHDFAVYQSNLTGAFARIETVVTTVAVFAAFSVIALLACRLVVEAVIAFPAIPDQSYDAHLLRLVARVTGLLAAGAVLVFGADRIGIPALGVIAGLGIGGGRPRAGGAVHRREPLWRGVFVCRPPFPDRGLHPVRPQRGDRRRDRPALVTAAWP